MTKIYKIGNKELQKISLIYGDKGEAIMGVSGVVNDVANTVNNLLEALSDKEECKQLCLNCFNKGKGLKEDITLGLSECDYCKEVEQPTSLKEEIWDNIDRGLQYYQYRPDGNNIPRTEYSKTLTEQTIKLIQSNLIKEIDKLNPEYATMATNLGYSDAKKDIIKIINNIK